ncbi:hypothetical protein ACFFII_08305 [Paracoccus niistensis]|uniref:Uncharacterized protein n=1 Tax=Paracoccus niistensis TaxID=632935 RepID=A0ABV6I3E9_9RHOB
MRNIVSTAFEVPSGLPSSSAAFLFRFRGGGSVGKSDPSKPGALVSMPSATIIPAGSEETAPAFGTLGSALPPGVSDAPRSAPSSAADFFFLFLSLGFFTRETSVLSGVSVGFAAAELAFSGGSVLIPTRPALERSSSDAPADARRVTVRDGSISSPP